MQKDNSVLLLVGAAAVLGYLYFKKSGQLQAAAIMPGEPSATPKLSPATDVKLEQPSFDPPEVPALKIMDPDDLGAGPDVGFVW
jgi:hypothetical protein